MKALMFLVCAVLAAVVFAGTEITWKGGGATTAWSDGSNWEGGTAPALGDTAVIPSGKTAGMSSADITYVSADATKLAGISLPAADATLWVTNRSEAKMKVSVSGVGHYLVDSNLNDFYIFANNPDFTGPFTMTNSFIYADFYSGLYIDKPFGHGNTVTIHYGKQKSSVRFFCQAGKTLSFDNKWVVYSTTSPDTTSFVLYCDVTFNNTFEVFGEYNFNCQNNMAYFKGGFSHAGAGACGVYTASGAVCLQSTPCDLTTTAGYGIGGVSLSQGTVRLSVPVTENTKRLIVGESAYGKGLIIDGDNVIQYPTKTSLQLGLGGASQGRLDLNGHDLVCADIYKNGNITGAGKLFVTSAVPAKLTMCGSAAWYADYMIDATQTMPISLDGYASFEINSTNRSTAGWMNFSAGTSNTKGSLYARCGTIGLYAATKWPNLKSIEVSGAKGKLKVATENINPDFRLIVSNVANSAVTLSTNIVAKAMYADKWLWPGTYGGADAGLDADHTLPQLTGSGTVEVKKWGGKPGLAVILR